MDWPPDLDGWSPNTQPTTQRHVEAMLRHVLRQRFPDCAPYHLRSIVEGVRMGLERYGLHLRRFPWTAPPGADLSAQTLADVPIEEAWFKCGICSREECHKRRNLIERFGAFRHVRDVPGLLSADCEERITGEGWCGFTFAQYVEELDPRTIKWASRMKRG